MAYRQNSPDRSFMTEAIEQQKLCEDTPKVGAVIVKDDIVVASGYRHEGKAPNAPGKHAEAVAIEKLQQSSIDSTGCILYVTMEPCNEAAKDCAAAIINSGIKEVVIGSYDLNPDVNRLGWKKLTDSGIKVRDFDSDMIIESRKQNPVEHFHKKTGPNGHGKFAYKVNGNKGMFELQFSDSDLRSITFGCSSRSTESVFLYGKRGASCAEVKFATQTSDIDNPDAYQFDYAAEAEVGSITIIKSSEGFALVTVTNVDHTNNTINFNFEIRSTNHTS